MTYNVFSGTLNPTQSINQSRREKVGVGQEWNCKSSPMQSSNHHYLIWLYTNACSYEQLLRVN